MDGGVKQAFATSLGTLAVPAVLWNVGDQARIENALAIVRRIKATIEVEIGASEVQPDLFGYLLQGFQTLRQQDHVRLIDGSNRQGSQDIAMVVRYRDDFLALLVFVAGVANPIAPFLATVLLLATWFLERETQRGKKWTPAMTLPQIRQGIAMI
jgi:hypothetical protein